MKTIREWLKYGEAQLLLGPHPEKARMDAEALLLHANGKTRSWFLAWGDFKMSETVATTFEERLARRLTGEPIQQIVGQCEFYGLKFHLTPDVLIPRPETEGVVEKALDIAAASDYKSLRVLDVGTGSGAIAISLSYDWNVAKITAIDASAAAIKVALGNASRYKFASGIRFLVGDLLAPVANERFDLIVSNPPYVPLADRDSLSVEVREYEPALALFAGDDGLDIYRRLIPQAFAALVPNGWLLLEIGYGQRDAIEQLLHAAGFVDIDFTPDLQGIPRVAAAKRPA